MQRASRFEVVTPGSELSELYHCDSDFHTCFGSVILFALGFGIFIAKDMDYPLSVYAMLIFLVVIGAESIRFWLRKIYRVMRSMLKGLSVGYGKYGTGKAIVRLRVAETVHRQYWQEYDQAGHGLSITRQVGPEATTGLSQVELTCD